MIAVLGTPRALLPRRLLAACLVMGFAALVGQVVLTRELLGLFSGNELSIALVLFCWLGAVAAGSAGGARVVRRFRTPESALGWSQAVTAALLPLSLALARRVQPGGLVPGQVLGPGAMLLASLEVLAPVCVVLGVQFVAAVEAVGAAAGSPEKRTGSPAALTYAAEAAGAVAGGVAFHVWAAQHLGPFATLAAVSLLALASAAALLRSGAAGPARLAPIGVLAAGALLLAVASPAVELSTLRTSPRWSGAGVVASASSRYGAIVVARQAGQVSLHQSGVLLFTSQDEYADEVAVHLPLLEHPAPRRVLIIGGNWGGEAREALKHPIAVLDCLELDPQVVASARRWFPSASLRPTRDPRVRLHIGDGRAFVRSVRGLYDVIIVNLPDPSTAAINRFYTADFLREARRALTTNGILAFGLTGSEARLAGPVQRAAATMDRTLGSVFPDRLIVPGERMLLLASPERAVLTADWRLLSARLAQRAVHTSFVNDVWLRDALLPLRARLARQAIAEVPDPPLNTDLDPISYYHQTRIWLAQLSPRLSGPARLLARMSLWWAAGVAALAVLVGVIARGRARRAAALLTASAAIGAFGMTMEIVALLLLQSARGYLYQAMALLMAAFMAGLALGAAVGGGRRGKRTPPGRLLVGLLAGAIGVSLLLPVLSRLLLRAPGAALPGLTALLLLVGCLVGMAFPVLTALAVPKRDASAAGAIYAADLLGSAAAALLAGVAVVPLLGLAGASLAVAICLGGVLALTSISLRG